MKRKEIHKGYHQVQKAGILMIRDPVKNVGSTTSPRILYKSVPKKNVIIALYFAIINNVFFFFFGIFES